jgi:hypothetical protein
VQDVDGAATAFHDAHAQLAEGASFYGDLVGRLLQVAQTCEGALYAASLRRRDLELSLGSSHDKATLEASDAALARRLAHELQMGDDGGDEDGDGSGGSTGALPPFVPPPAHDFPSVPAYAPAPPTSFARLDVSAAKTFAARAAASAVDAPPPFYQAAAAAPPPDAAAAAADPAAISRLADMGFAKADAARALETHGGNEEAALNQLLGGT